MFPIPSFPGRTSCCQIAILLFLILRATTGNAATLQDTDHSASLLPPSAIATLTTEPNAFIEEHVQEHYPFSGLALYLNDIRYYIVDKAGIRKPENDTRLTLATDQRLAVVGRFNVLLMSVPGLQFQINEKKLVFIQPRQLLEDNARIALFDKASPLLSAPDLGQLRYAHLWPPLAALAKAFEATVVGIQRTVVAHWAGSIAIAALLVRLLLTPVTILTGRWQAQAAQIQQKLAPVLSEIKVNYDGEDAHQRMMAAHKALGVTPFYSLKPMFATMIQLPVLIAVFNALAEMPQLNGATLLWIDNLAYPDAVAGWGSTLPMIGSTLNLLPFVMTVVNVVATLGLATNDQAQKRNLYLMSAAFLVLFYPFPAAMVYYWTLANFFTLAQQIISKRLKE